VEAGGHEERVVGAFHPWVSRSAARWRGRESMAEVYRLV